MSLNFKHYIKTGQKISGGSGRSVYENETVEKVMAEIYNGAGLRATAKKYGVKKSTASRWVNGQVRNEITGDGLYEKYKREHSA